MYDEEDVDIISRMFEEADSEFLKFDRIPENERRHTRHDLCAFLYLEEKLGNGSERDVIDCAEHDEIWLDFDNLAKLTKDDIIYITRCGVLYDSDYNSLRMFA